MAISIVPYETGHIDQVVAFNARLKAKGVHFQFPDHPVPKWLPPQSERELFQEYFVAVDESGMVRGAYILKHQNYYVNGQVISIGDYQLPMSEGIIDRKYNMVGLNLMTDALRRQPLMYALGMGGFDRPLPKFLKAMKWRLVAVPFYFYINHPFTFLRKIQVLRNSTMRKLALDILAFSGIGPLGVNIRRLLKQKSMRTEIERTNETEFGDWVDSIEQQAHGYAQFCAVRDHETLRILYPEKDQRFIRLRIEMNNQPVGWAVLLDTPMTAHKQFGNMRVGTIVDGHALSGYEKEVVSHSCRYLKQQGVDLVVSNQAHENWGEAMLHNGFMTGPSNFIFAASPALVRAIGREQFDIGRMHLNRGDGDGPINL